MSCTQTDKDSDVHNNHYYTILTLTVLQVRTPNYQFCCYHLFNGINKTPFNITVKVLLCMSTSIIFTPPDSTVSSDGVAQLVERQTREPERPKVRTSSASGAQEKFVRVL